MYSPVPMASAAVLQLLLISLVVFGAVTWSATATIVPCKPPSNIPIVKGDKIGKCGFLIPNNTIQQQLSQSTDHCEDFGSFKGTKQGQPFRDPCKPNVTIDKIELTTGQSPVMIRSLKTTYSDGSVYSHGTPTDELYTIDFTTFNPRLYLVGSVVSYSDVVYRITFIGMDHYLKQYCYFGPIGGDDGDWKIEFSPVNAFYGDADVGINSIGYYGCIQEPLLDLDKLTV